MANVTISSFPAQSAMTDATIIPTVYSNLNYQISGANLLPYFQSNLPGGNVVGEVANANFATTSGSANTAATANSVALSNVAGIGNIANININGNSSQVLAGNGAWITPAAGYSNANVAAYLPNNSSNVSGNNFTARGDMNVGSIGSPSAVVSVFASTPTSVTLEGMESIPFPVANGDTIIITGATGPQSSINGTWVVSNLAIPYYDINCTAQPLVEYTPGAQLQVVSGGDVTAVGNITADYFIGNGSQLTGLPAGYSNADVATYLADPTTNGNIYAGNLTVLDATTLNTVEIVGSLFGNASASPAPSINNFSSISVYDGIASGGNITAVGTTTTANLEVTGAAAIANWAHVPQWWFKGTLSNTQPLTANVDVTLLWDDNNDPASWGGTTATNGQIIPDVQGWYDVTSRVTFSGASGNSTNQLNHQIAVNGVQESISQLPDNITVGSPVTIIATAMVYLNGTTDYITSTSYTSVTGQEISGQNSSMILVRWVST